jgi:hypothetical protein
VAGRAKSEPAERRAAMMGRGGEVEGGGEAGQDGDEQNDEICREAGGVIGGSSRVVQDGGG